MKDYQKNKNFKKFIYSRPFIAVLFVLVLIFAYGVVGFWRKMEVTRENRILSEKKITELKQEKQKLITDIEKLKTEDGVEESIRSKFGLAKEGESMIIVVDEKKVEPPQEIKQKSWWSFFKSLFY